MIKKRLIIEVSEEQHKEVKLRALEQNITLRKWILRAILQKIKFEEQYK